MASSLENKSVDEICDFLEDQGFPESLLTSFRDEDMDGTAIALALATGPGPDWLKDVVKKVGLRLKVHNALRTLCNECEPSNDDRSKFSPSSSDGGSLRSPSTSSITSPQSTSNIGSDCTPKSSSKKGGKLPKPFPIPKFRPDTEDNLMKKVLTDGDRKYIVQVLATMMMTHVQKPSLSECGEVAKSLVSEFTFLKDDEGDGEHSWKWFLYYRCQNVLRKSDKSGAPTPKRSKHDNRAVHLYPPINGEDEITFKRNVELLNAERTKPSASMANLKKLMNATFPNRWDSYVNDSEPPTLVEYLAQFPLLKKATYACQDFALICKQDDIKAQFEEAFPLWAMAVIQYSRNTQIKSSALQAETEQYSKDMDEGDCANMALRCLALLLTRLKRLDGESIPFIIKFVPRGTTPAEAPERNNNQPHIVVFLDNDDRTLIQYFVSVEQELMLECHSISLAIFYCVAAHYVFNLSYHQKTGDVWLFIQEKVIGIPTKAGVKRHPSSVSHFSGITREYERVSAHTVSNQDEGDGDM